MDREHLHGGCSDPHGIEIRHGVIGELVIERRVCRVADRIDKKNRIAVRRRLGRAASSDVAAGTRRVLDIELLSQPVG